MRIDFRRIRFIYISGSESYNLQVSLFLFRLFSTPRCTAYVATHSSFLESNRLS